MTTAPPTSSAALWLTNVDFFKAESIFRRTEENNVVLLWVFLSSCGEGWFHCRPLHSVGQAEWLRFVCYNPKAQISICYPCAVLFLVLNFTQLFMNLCALCNLSEDIPRVSKV